MTPEKLKSLLAFVGIVLFVQLIGSYASSYGIEEWYPGLSRPIFSPPEWIFPPVWTLLYFMVAVAGWLVYQNSSGEERHLAMTLWGIQLVLNGLWPWFFFVMKSPRVALYDIGLLWIVVAVSILYFWKFSRLASFLLLPYFFWVGFAGVLSTWIFWYN